MVTHPTCEICDRSDDTVEYWQQGVQAHVGCVPAYWKTDRADHEIFQARLHRVRYELTSEGKVTASCLKCDWTLTDWPNGVGDLYRKAADHDKEDN